MRRALAALMLSLSACRPELGDPESLVTGPRILAVRGDPAEASPGEQVAHRALVVGPSGAIAGAAFSWAFCAAPKPLTENDAVAADCLGDAVRPVEADAPIPMDACQLFGPDPPPGGLRPRDPDSTGGFYQPIRVRSGDLTAVRLDRVLCDLPGAPIDVAIELAKRYRKNRNPTLAALSATVAGQSVALDRIPAGATVRLTTGWRDDDTERFVMFDPGSASLVERREELTVAWFVTAGELTSEVTGAGDHGTTTETGWRAPPDPGPAHLWLVLRDSRGGVDFAGHDLQVTR